MFAITSALANSAATATGAAAMIPTVVAHTFCSYVSTGRVIARDVAVMSTTSTSTEAPYFYYALCLLLTLFSYD